MGNEQLTFEQKFTRLKNSFMINRMVHAIADDPGLLGINDNYFMLEESEMEQLHELVRLARVAQLPNANGEVKEIKSKIDNMNPAIHDHFAGLASGYIAFEMPLRPA